MEIYKLNKMQQEASLSSEGMKLCEVLQDMT